MTGRVVLATLFVPLLASAAHAKVWKHTRPDGTVEFTSAPRGGKGWDTVSKFEHGPSAEPETEVRTLPRARGANVVWTRERDDGIVEFTNLQPVGRRWKVLFRLGPGKASSVRGASDLVPARDTSAARTTRYDGNIRDQQVCYGIPQALIRAVIRTESDYDPNVVSSAGAQGLMQLMPATARAMGVTNVWDPRQNIMGGARYLQLLARRYCHTPAAEGAAGRTTSFVCSLDEKVKVLAGYHAGPGAVDKYGGMPPYETTRSYVTTVLQRFEEYRRREAALSEWSEAVPFKAR
ncbi:MAG TPA: lytic transglycosylase domain-containing protein [Polyangia bacterium]